jgi:hypothetical protein
LNDGSEVDLRFTRERQTESLDALLGEHRNELKKEWIEATLGDRQIIVQRSAVTWFVVETGE